MASASPLKANSAVWLKHELTAAAGCIQSMKTMAVDLLGHFPEMYSSRTYVAASQWIHAIIPKGSLVEQVVSREHLSVQVHVVD